MVVLIRNVETYKSALNNSVGINTQFPDSYLGYQLRTVANTISARNNLNVRTTNILCRDRRL